jgi:hypothetical protein
MKLLEAKEVGHGILIEHDGSTNRVLDSGYINENVHLVRDKNRLYIECILQKANTKNRNGRIYPRPILEQELAKYINLIKERNSYGEADHPETPVISLRKEALSHLVTEVWWVGDTLWGVIEILTSEKYEADGSVFTAGDFIASLLKKGCKLGISSRGLGSVKKQGDTLIVQNDFELVGWDIVSSPSTPDAYLFREVKGDNVKDMNENTIINTNKKTNKLTKYLKK